VQRNPGWFHLAELRIDERQRQLGGPQAGHIDLERIVQGTLAIMLAVGVDRQRHPVPAGMVGIELGRPLRQRAALLPVAGKGELNSEVGGGIALQAVERQSAPRYAAERGEITAAEQGRSQRGVRNRVKGSASMARRAAANERPSGSGRGLNP
jgi:hypothetical protein